MTSVFF
ncbi:unnamed protein product, partial [Allacma fusca]